MIRWIIFFAIQRLCFDKKERKRKDLPVEHLKSNLFRDSLILQDFD